MQLTPADKFINRVSSFFGKPYSNGLLLLFMVLIAMLWANLGGESYHHFFDMVFAIGFEGFELKEPLHIWINDGLMALFFFTVGLEIKREVIHGELSTMKKASLPIVAAIGGMVVPALIFLSINYGTEVQKGWSIPMATDIAFTLGLISLLGSMVPQKLKVFLTALATVDDLGAILVIALFLTPFIDVESLIAGGFYFLVMLGANKLGVRNVWFYLIVGVLGLWLALLLSGIHATLAGVLGAFAIPATRKIKEQEYLGLLKKWQANFHLSCSDEDGLLNEEQEHMINEIIQSSKWAATPLQRLEKTLHPVVYYFVLPLFALANAGVTISGNIFEMLSHPLCLGIILGLVVGKVTGICSFSYFMVRNGWSELPEGSNWSQTIGVGLFAGIGFTMSLFIAELAINDEELLGYAKLAILAASVISALLGFLWFAMIARRVKANN